jgi:8-oxo-dGTP pyrophosphatase MutT (NUDIX family)
MKRGKKHQVAVLVVSSRRAGQILLVTSRNSKSWSLAKGNIDRALGPVETARKEAFEEAGVRGRMLTKPIGTYAHYNSAGGKFRVKVFKMHVREQLSTWPERKERRRRWVSVRQALKLITNPSLRRLISAQF